MYIITNWSATFCIFLMNCIIDTKLESLNDSTYATLSMKLDALLSNFKRIKNMRGINESLFSFFLDSILNLLI